MHPCPSAYGANMADPANLAYCREVQRGLFVQQIGMIYQDDSQIDRILIERREIEKGGAVVVKITTIKEKK